VAEYDKVIPSRSEGKITVKIHGHKIHPGRFKKSWTVATNDPDNKRLILYVGGSIKKVFEFSGQLAMSGFRDEEMKGETILTNLLDEPINVKGWRWDEKATQDGIDKKVGIKLDVIEQGRKYRISAWKRKGVEPEHYRGEVVLETDYTAMPEKKIGVRMTVTPDVEVHPNKVYFGEMVVREGVSKSFDRQIRIIAARSDTLEILKVVPDSDEITVKIQEVQAGKVYKGTVSVRPSAKVGSYMGSIKIYTNYPGYEELSVVIAGAVRKAGQVTPIKEKQQR
jgi:hypothetical protein